MLIKTRLKQCVKLSLGDCLRFGAIKMKKGPRKARAFRSNLDGLTELFSQFWHCFKKISNKTKVSDLENRRFFIFVDCNDDF